MKDTNYNAIIAAHADALSKRKENGEHTTVVINAFGGPGAGKSTASLGIAEELKKLGYVAEYVPEYSKELVWDENWELLDGSAAHQFVILEEQMKRMDRLVGKVDFVVTDAPILLNQIYNKELTQDYEGMLQKLYGQYENFNFVVQRNPEEFEAEGRIHDLQESQQKDKEITSMLDRYGLYYGSYNHTSVNKVIANAVKTHQRVSSELEIHSEPLRAVVYGKDSRKDVYYGESVKGIIQMLQEKSGNDRSGKVYIGSRQSEPGKYNNYKCYDINSGRDITPIYLDIPHIADRKAFRELTKQLKEEGARYNPKSNKWYVTKEMLVPGSMLQKYIPNEPKRESIKEKLRDFQDKSKTEGANNQDRSNHIEKESTER